MTFSHDFRTYWRDWFNINVQTFDGKINSEPRKYDFDGRIDGVDVTAMLSFDNNLIATIKGTTQNNGHWEGEYYFTENVNPGGQYQVDVFASYLGANVSKTSSMFLIPDVVDIGMGNNSPVADAGEDYSEDASDPDCAHPLDGSGSYDPDGDSLTYSWRTIPENAFIIMDKTAETTFFINCFPWPAFPFELTVTDSKGRSSSDIVYVTLT